MHMRDIKQHSVRICSEKVVIRGGRNAVRTQKTSITIIVGNDQSGKNPVNGKELK